MVCVNSPSGSTIRPMFSWSNLFVNCVTSVSKFISVFHGRPLPRVIAESLVANSAMFPHFELRFLPFVMCVTIANQGRLLDQAESRQNRLFLAAGCRRQASFFRSSNIFQSPSQTLESQAVGPHRTGRAIPGLFYLSG